MLLSACVLSVGAQVDAGDSIACKIHQIDEVEVVSTASSSPIGAASPVQHMGHERMVELGAETVTDALKHVAGITVRDYGGAGGMKTVSVRGMGTRHTVTSYDGIVLNDCQTGETDLSRYSLDHAKSLALTIGDGDDIFVPARNIAAASTLALEMAQPPTADTSPHVDAILKTGSWDMLNPSVYYGRSVSEKLSLSVVGEYVYAENDYPFTLVNYRQRTRERRVNSRMSAGHVEANMVWQAGADHTVKGKVYYYDNDRQLPGIVRYYTNSNDETLHDRNAFGQIGYKGRFSEKWSLAANAKWNWAKTVYHNGNPAAGVASGTYQQEEAYLSAATLYEPARWFAMDYSADYYRQTMHTAAHPERDAVLQSLTGKVRTGRLTLIGRALGALYLEHLGEDVFRVCPSVSASYRLLPHRNLYMRASWKEIFRMPTFNELYFNNIGGANLKPENSTQWNVGVNWASDDNACLRRPWKLQLTCDAYLNRVTDKIIAIPFNMFVWRMSNMAKVTIYGVDLTADVSCSLNGAQTLGLIANYSWQRAENRINRLSPYYHHQIAYVPEHSACVTALWQNPWVNVSVTSDGMTERWTTNEHHTGTRLAGFVEMDLNAYRSFSLRKILLTVKGSILNLLDKQYEMVAHYPLPGRSWRISFELTI